MENKIEELKQKFIHAKSETEKAEVDIEMRKLAEENREDFSNCMLSSIKNTNDRLQEERLRNKLESILPVLSVSYLSKQYFGKTPQWFYQRLNGNSVNGKQASFTDNELKILAGALTDISNKIQQSVAFVV
jgi:hypothetical protein